MKAYQGIKRIKDIVGEGEIKGRIKMGPELIVIGSVLDIAYKGQEVIGREYFSLEDGEIDFDLV
jgi:hypothetical protein